MSKFHPVPLNLCRGRGRPRRGGITLLYPLLGGLVLFCAMRQSCTSQPISGERSTAGQQNFLSKQAHGQSEAILLEDSPSTRVLAPRSREPGCGLANSARDQFLHRAPEANNLSAHFRGNTLASPIHALNCVWLT